jgi:DNA processing protein
VNESDVIRIAISGCDFLNAREKLELDELVSSSQFFRSLSIGRLCQVTGRRLRSLTWDPVAALEDAERKLAFCRSRNVKLVSYWDGAYPPALREIYDPPFLLFLRGRLPATELPSVAIVGTRGPTGSALRAAEALSAELAASGIPVISGLARGIDSAAHRGVLRAGGVTGAVLACGIDQVCPSSHRPLAAELLASGGFLVSEYPPGTQPDKYRFPARNRIISGMARGVVVVQAPARSGALITADYALDHGRDLYVHAEGVIGERGEGSAALAQDGAMVIRSAWEIREDWGLSVEHGMDVREGNSPFAERPFGEAPVRGGAEMGFLLAERLRSELVARARADGAAGPLRGEGDADE